LNALTLTFEEVVIDGRRKCCGMEDRTVVADGRLPYPAQI